MIDSSLNSIVQGIIAIQLRSEIKSAEKPDIFEDIGTLLKTYKVPTDVMGAGGIGDISNALRDTLDWLLTQWASPPTTKDVLLRLKFALGRDEEILPIFIEAFSAVDEPDDYIERRIRSCMLQIHIEVQKGKTAGTLMKALSAVKSNVAAQERKARLQDVIKSLTELTTLSEDAGPMSVSSFNSEQPDKLEELFENSKMIMSHAGAIKTGYDAIDIATGLGGLTRGYFIMLNALSHNYKTGMLLTLMATISQFKPVMWDEDKKPLLLRISFENRIEQDLPTIYRDMMEQRTGKTVKVSDIPSKELSSKLIEEMGRTGFHVAMEFFSPNDFTVDMLIAVLDRYIRSGYEIHCLFLDYAALLAEGKFKSGELTLALEQTVERLRGYTFPRGITVLSAHQLNSEAGDLAKTAGNWFVDQLPGGGYYKQAKTLHTKFDGELFMHIIEVCGRSFLTIRRGKWRNGDRVNSKLKKFAYELKRVGSLIPDIFGAKAIYDFSTVKHDVDTDAPSDAHAVEDEELSMF